MKLQSITNFGRNRSFTAAVHEPRSEAEVLAVLASCAGRSIRAVGRLHSWSEVILADDVLIDLRHMQGVRIEDREGRPWVTVEAGCQIKRLLAELDQHGLTMPSIGLITEQTIAGAMSTGTHGSGKHCLSHYAEEIRLATYDAETGIPVVSIITDGEELRAARCSLGALGIMVSIGFWARPAYRVEEFVELYDRLDDVLAKEADYPLQQFFLIPWRWKYFGQHRRETDRPRSLLAGVYRWYFFLSIDVLMHLWFLLLCRVVRSARFSKFFFRHIASKMVIRNWQVVDRSQAQLIMEHELFRHIEIEMFVRRPQLDDSLSYVIELLQHFDGDATALPETRRAQLQEAGLLKDLDRARGSYTHQYMICVRRILPDNTLISMTSGGDESWYSLSFISYASPGDRRGFYTFAEQLCRTMVALFRSRPHWGKYCPLTKDEVEQLYPNLPAFRRVCDRYDRPGIFRNQWLKTIVLADQETSSEPNGRSR
ncbi:MAG: FAD-binding protein [Planctomycetaceae bacterium]